MLVGHEFPELLMIDTDLRPTKGPSKKSLATPPTVELVQIDHDLDGLSLFLGCG